MLDDLLNYWAMAKISLWPPKDRRVPWRDLAMRAKTDPTWPWMPGARGLDVLRDEALKQGRWRQTPEGHIEKGPFPAEKTSVNITVLGTNRETGETGPPTRWTADLTIRHEVHKVADNRKVELRGTPPAQLRFTLDGINAKEARLYSEPFAVPAKGCTILIAAKAGDVEKAAKIQVPADGDERVIIDDGKPARLADTKRVSIDTTDKAFGFIQRFRNRADTRLRGIKIIIGEGEHAVEVRFNERELTAAAIETAINSIRSAIDDEQAAVQILMRGGVTFGDGYALKEFADAAGIALKRGDVIQDAG